MSCKSNLRSYWIPLDNFTSTFISLTSFNRFQIMQKFLNEMLTKKKKLPVDETVKLTKECSAIIKQVFSLKLEDLWSFTVPYFIGNSHNLNALIDSGTRINLMPPSIYEKLGLEDLKAKSIILQLVDRTLKHLYGVEMICSSKLEINLFLLIMSSSI